MNTLRVFVDAAANNCKDRLSFYNDLEKLGPKEAYLRFSNREGTNKIWLPQIKEILGIKDEN